MLRRDAVMLTIDADFCCLMLFAFVFAASLIATPLR